MPKQIVNKTEKKDEKGLLNTIQEIEEKML